MRNKLLRTACILKEGKAPCPGYAKLPGKQEKEVQRHLLPRVQADCWRKEVITEKVRDRNAECIVRRVLSETMIVLDVVNSVSLRIALRTIERFATV